MYVLSVYDVRKYSVVGWTLQPWSMATEYRYIYIHTYVHIIGIIGLAVACKEAWTGLVVGLIK